MELTSKPVVWVKEEDQVPLVGCIAFGIIDRGTNLLQIRPSSLCPLSCIFCSTDAGPKSRHRQTEFLVEADLLVEHVRQVIKAKGEKEVEAHLDGVGEPTTHPRIIDIVQGLSEIPEVKVISMQTNAVLLDEHKVDELADAGLTRLNISINALDPELAKKLAGTDDYDLSKVLQVTEYACQHEKVDVLIAPVLLLGLNEQEIPKIVRYALKVGAGKRFPPLGIQKYERHKYGRKPKGVRHQSWREFFDQLRVWESEFGVKLILSPQDFGIRKTRPLPCPFKKGDVVKAELVYPGWLKREVIAAGKGRLITVVDYDEPLRKGARKRLKIVHVKDNMALAVTY